MSNAARRYSASWGSLIVAVFLSILLMTVDARTSWLNPVRDVLSFLVTPVQKIAALPSWASNTFNELLSSEGDVQLAYDNLRKEYFQLKSEMLLMRALERENDNLRALLSASDRLEQSVQMAQLMDVSIDAYQHRLLVNRGIKSGAYIGQAVVDDTGVIGQITEAMPLNSTVTLLTDPSHALPVQVKRNSLRTIVYGTGSISILKVPYLNQNTDIKVGDVLLTSGLGGRFPVGYPVAVVTDIQTVSDEAFMKITAEPLAKANRSNQVLLISVQGGED